MPGRVEDGGVPACVGQADGQRTHGAGPPPHGIAWLPDVPPTSEAVMHELAEHLPLLEALFLRFAAESVAAPDVDRKSRLLGMSLKAQRAYSQTLVLVQGLVQQQRQ